MKGGNADGKENKGAEKSDISTYPARFRNWNSHRCHQNGDREHPIRNGEGNLPYLKNTTVCL